MPENIKEAFTLIRWRETLKAFFVFWAVWVVMLILSITVLGIFVFENFDNIEEFHGFMDAKKHIFELAGNANIFLGFYGVGFVLKERLFLHLNVVAIALIIINLISTFLYNEAIQNFLYNGIIIYGLMLLAVFLQKGRKARA